MNQLIKRNLFENSSFHFPGEDRCFDYAADIGFVMDSSRSVNEEDFDRQKEFIIGIIKQFQVSVDEVLRR